MEYKIPKIDPKVFKYPRIQIGINKTEQIRQETPILPIIKGTGRDKGGGILIYYEGMPEPRKGFPDADILTQLNPVKKITLSYLKGFICKANIGEIIVFGIKPWYLKKKSIEKFLEEYRQIANYFLEWWYYQDGTAWGWGRLDYDLKHDYKENYYCLAAKETENFITNFLYNLGFPMGLCTNIAEIPTMFLENDDKYRMMFQDLMSESSVEKLSNPFKEIPRLFKLFKQRDKSAESHTKATDKFDSLQYMKWLFLYPKFKKAWIKALYSIDFSKMQFDKTDRYWALTWGSYDAMGRSFEDRRAEYEIIHKDLKPQYVKMNPTITYG